ncbi:MAG: hypothetical protein WAL59_15890 [Roseiarcus sp.]
MIVNAISQLGARLPDTNRTWETAGASRTRKFMSIRATHGAAYNATIVDDAAPDGMYRSAQQHAAPLGDDPSMDVAEPDGYALVAETSSVSRRVTTLDASPTPARV